MLRVKDGIYDTEVRFYHELIHPDDIETKIGTNTDKSRMCSRVTVICNGTLVGEGIAICHPDDNFCRSVGRKKALAKALFHVGKRVRKMIWKEYEATIGF